MTPAPQLVGDVSADVLVIGGGYTGMWAAWWVKRLEPEARVVLLESEVCGFGPSGRNGGFCNVMWFSLANMRQRWGDAGGLAVARASREAIDGIEAFCREQEVDAWFRRGGYLQVSTAPAHDRVWDEAVAASRELGEGDAVRPLSSAAVAERCASPAFRGGAFYPDAATVQPARLALGLRKRLLVSGVHIYEHSPVRRLAADCCIVPSIGGTMQQYRAGDGIVAETDGGTVRAGAAVLAIGGAAKAPGAPLRDALTVTSSHIVLTEPVPDLLEEIGWTGGECITDGRTLIDYFRTTPDGRIAFGWGGGRIAMGARLRGRAELDRSVVSAAAARMREYFPGLAGKRITHAWGGPVRRVSHPHPDGRPAPRRRGRWKQKRPGRRRRQRLRRRGLHRQRRGPIPHGRPNPRLPSPGPPRRSFPPPLRRPSSPARAPRAPPLAGRRNHPPCLDNQGERRALQPKTEPPQLPDLPSPQTDRRPHRPLIAAADFVRAMACTKSTSPR